MQLFCQWGESSDLWNHVNRNKTHRRKKPHTEGSKELRGCSVLSSTIFEVIFMIMYLSLSLLTLCGYFRKPFLGLQGHNPPAFVPSGHLAVWERHAHSEYWDSCLVGRCRQNLLLQRRQVCVEWLLVKLRGWKLAELECEDHWRVLCWLCYHIVYTNNTQSIHTII